MKVKDLLDWPPDSFSRVGHGKTPTHADDVTIADKITVFNDSVTFNCIYRNETVLCRFPVRDPSLRTKLARIFEDNQGKILLTIGEIDIPAD